MTNKLQGITFIILSGFFFSLMTFFVRLSGDLPTMEKVFFRNAVAAIISIVLLARSDDKFHVQKSSWPSLLIRCICGTAGIICNFYTLDKIGLADANMLNKMSPFFAIIFSVFILKEIANRTEWICVIIAFLGILCVIKPSANVTSIYGFIGLLGGLGAGIAYTLVRKLGNQGERSTIIVMCFSTFSCLVALPFMCINFVPMTSTQLACLLLAGLSATGGQFCVTRAYTKAPAKEISVFDYTQILFAALLGFFFFHETPDLLSILGYFIIISVAVFKWRYALKQGDI